MEASGAVDVRVAARFTPEMRTSLSEPFNTDIRNVFLPCIGNLSLSNKLDSKLFPNCA